MCRRRDGLRLLHQLSISDFSDAKESTRRDIANRFQEMAKFTFAPSRSVYSSVDNETRIRLIGSCLAQGGDEWMDKHPTQVRWMAENGVTPQQAVDAYETWFAKYAGSGNNPA